MKILITTIFKYPHEGGLSTHVATLKKGLEERGHQVDILSFSDMNPVLRKTFTQAPGFILNKIKAGKGQLLNDRLKKKLLSSYLEKCKDEYDVINSQDVFAAISSIETGVPTVATVHGYFSFEAISRGALIPNSKEDLEVQEIEKRAYQEAAQVIAVDKRIKDYIMEKTNVSATTIKNFIDVTSFQTNNIDTKSVKEENQIPEGMKILFVPRRLTEKNGVTFPALALPKVLDKHPDTMLVYAGTGEQMEKIQDIVTEKNLHNNVKLLGSVPHEKMKGLYALSDIVLVPSVHSHGVEEATSISALEAMGSGSPVVAGAVGGLKEIFEHEKDGLLVKEKDVDDLATSIIRILDDSKFGDMLAKNARTKVEQEYSHLAAAEKYEEIYKLAIEQNKKVSKN
ncbi:glycosyltransferase family 4 protein [Bacillaceae bacterium CLA-AA-H227]|uniref:Glycosyltransferase family 4 protein n=1 Tax=Robertmurraya yapensis (ex Hitch et al 2024) TaxID=3133160 RepID=A0ACC6SC00_9BACI